MLFFSLQPFVDEGAIALIPDAIIVKSGHAASLIHVDIGASRSTLPNFRRGGSSIERLMCDVRVWTLPRSKEFSPFPFYFIATNDDCG